MWLYFDDTGALIKSLEHGPDARVGTTKFQIFAYFDGVDLDEFNVATIKLVRDDIEDSSHPSLLMSYVHNVPFVLNKDNDETAANVSPFVPGQRYNGYLFDFARFAGEQDVAVLLDTPGKWKAVITLFSGNKISVQGTAVFYVQGPRLETDPYIASIDDVVSNIAQEWSRRSDQFIFVDELEGTLSEEDLQKISGNKINRIVYNNIVYYYSLKDGDVQKYFSIAKQVDSDTDYNEIDVNILTGEYEIVVAHDKYWEDHINNRVVHITQQEREFWNNKVTTNSIGEELILTKD